MRSGYEIPATQAGIFTTSYPSLNYDPLWAAYHLFGWSNDFYFHALGRYGYTASDSNLVDASTPSSISTRKM